MLFQSTAADSHTTHVLSVVLVIAPALVGAGVNWLHDNSRSTRRSQLSDRLLGMVAAYRGENPGNDEVLVRAHAALADEIGAICNEIVALQAVSQRTSQQTLYSWISDALLLYWPCGFVAWVVHLVFYAGLILLSFAVLGQAMFGNDLHEAEGTQYFLLGCFFFGLLLFGLQRLAIRLRKRQRS